MPRRTREPAVVFVGCGGGLARTGTPRGCFYDDGNYRQGWLWRGGKFSPRLYLSFSRARLPFLSSPCGELLILAKLIPLVHAKGFLFHFRRWGRVSRIGASIGSSCEYPRRSLICHCGTRNRFSFRITPIASFELANSNSYFDI